MRRLNGGVEKSSGMRRWSLLDCFPLGGKGLLHNPRMPGVSSSMDLPDKNSMLCWKTKSTDKGTKFSFIYLKAKPSTGKKLTFFGGFPLKSNLLAGDRMDASSQSARFYTKVCPKASSSGLLLGMESKLVEDVFFSSDLENPRNRFSGAKLSSC